MKATKLFLLKNILNIYKQIHNQTIMTKISLLKDFEENFDLLKVSKIVSNFLACSKLVSNQLRSSHLRSNRLRSNYIYKKLLLIV